MWFKRAKLMQCYCSRMHLVVWEDDSRKDPIMHCDGRELALAALAEAEAAAELEG